MISQLYYFPAENKQLLIDETLIQYLCKIILMENMTEHWN